MQELTFASDSLGFTMASKLAPDLTFASDFCNCFRFDNLHQIPARIYIYARFTSALALGFKFPLKFAQ